MGVEQQITQHRESPVIEPGQAPEIEVTRVSLKSTREGNGGLPPGESGGRGEGPTYRPDGETQQARQAPADEPAARPRKPNGEFAREQSPAATAASRRTPRTFAEALAKGKGTPAAAPAAAADPTPEAKAGDHAKEAPAATNGKTNGHANGHAKPADGPAAKLAEAAKDAATPPVEDKVTSQAFIEINRRAQALRQTEESTKAGAAKLAEERAKFDADRAQVAKDMEEVRAFKALQGGAKGDPLGWLKLGGLKLEEAMQHRIDHGEAPTAAFVAAQHAKEAEDRLRAEYAPKLEAIDKQLREANELRQQAHMATLRADAIEKIGKTLEADPDRWELVSRYRRNEAGGNVVTGRDEVLSLIVQTYQNSRGQTSLSFEQASDMIEAQILSEQEPLKGSKKLGYQPAPPAQDTATPDARSKASPPARTMTNSQVTNAAAPAPRGYDDAKSRRQKAIDEYRKIRAGKK